MYVCVCVCVCVCVSVNLSLCLGVISWHFLSKPFQSSLFFFFSSIRSSIVVSSITLPVSLPFLVFFASILPASVMYVLTNLYLSLLYLYPHSFPLTFSLTSFSPCFPFSICLFTCLSFSTLSRLHTSCQHALSARDKFLNTSGNHLSASSVMRLYLQIRRLIKSGRVPFGLP